MKIRKRWIVHRTTTSKRGYRTVAIYEPVEDNETETESKK